MYKLLIIEDNHDIVANLYGFFEPKGYVLDNAANGASGLTFATQNQYDLILLDIGLPKLDGNSLCQTLRQEYKNFTPILMLTAKDNVDDKVLGLTSGADDYLVKPFSLKELEARIQALIRRSQPNQSNDTLKVGELELNPNTRQVTREGKVIKPTPTGFTLLHTLMLHSPNVVNKAQLEEAVWGEDTPCSDALRTHMHSLRQQVDKPFEFHMLQTIAGLGYQLLEQQE